MATVAQFRGGQEEGENEEGTKKFENAKMCYFYAVIIKFGLI